MIKEYSWYITHNRFSEIIEQLDSLIREYSLDFENKKKREDVRKIFQEQAIKSGLRQADNAFINVDTEFFENGQLNESSLNKFLKDIVKNHCYQKVLWEYMGTTGLMTEISKSAMAQDGFVYENFLPLEIRNKAISKKNDKICRNFNKLKDDSGFDWGKGYDPNDTLKKNWKGYFDSNGYWTRFDNTSENKSNLLALSSNEKKLIKIVKTETGCILYDPGMLIINPLILYYLTLKDEIYGIEKINTDELIENLKSSMNTLKIDEITDIACSDENQSVLEDYKKVLGKLLTKKPNFIEPKIAEAQIKNNEEEQKLLKKEQQSLEFEQKVISILSANPNLESEKIFDAINTGKATVVLDITDENDAKKVGINEEEYNFIVDNASILKKAAKEDFLKTVLVLSSQWEIFKSSALDKLDFITKIFNYIRSNEDSDFTLETTLEKLIKTESESVIKTKESVEEVLQSIPSENQESIKEYIEKLPAQKNEVKQKVDAVLVAAIKNYITVRSSTGLSIKEYFDYAVKSVGGSVAFEPPVTGFITPGMNSKTNANRIGEKRIFIDTKISETVQNFKNAKLPEKIVDLDVIEKTFEVQNKKPVVILGSFNKNEDSKRFIEISNENINPIILSILKKLTMDNANTQKHENSEKKYNNSDKNRINKLIEEIALNSKTENEFISKLEEKFNVKYNLSDDFACSIFTKCDSFGSKIDSSVLNDYITEINQKSEKENVESKLVANITPTYMQIDSINSNPEKKVLSKSSPLGVLESTYLVSKREIEEKSVEKSNVTNTNVANIDVANTDLPSEQYSAVFNQFKENEKQELLSIVGGDISLITPALIKKYLDLRKSSFIDSNSANIDVTNTNVTNTINTESDIRNVLESLQEYERKDLLTAADGNINLITPLLVKTYLENKCQKNNSHVTIGVPIGNTSNEIAETPFTITPELQKTLQKLGERNHLNEETQRIDKMNANYEHDKSVLAKTDPIFAKNQFWDVGHAKESGEMSNRDLDKFIIDLQNLEINKIEKE